jgi:hypothetical protein
MSSDDEDFESDDVHAPWILRDMLSTQGARSATLRYYLRNTGRL